MALYAYISWYWLNRYSAKSCFTSMISNIQSIEAESVKFISGVLTFLLYTNVAERYKNSTAEHLLHAI